MLCRYYGWHFDDKTSRQAIDSQISQLRGPAVDSVFDNEIGLELQDRTNMPPKVDHPKINSLKSAQLKAELLGLGQPQEGNVVELRKRLSLARRV